MSAPPKKKASMVQPNAKKKPSATKIRKPITQVDNLPENSFNYRINKKSFF
jgi:hypothetical protein